MNTNTISVSRCADRRRACVTGELIEAAQTNRRGDLHVKVSIHVLTTALCLALVALAGCSDDTTPGGGDDAGLLDVSTDSGFDGIGTGDVGPSCDDNSDCGGGELCVDGLCRPFCLDNDNCPSGAPICDDDRNLCVQCLGNTDCGDEQVCTNDVCVDIDSGCSDNSDCSGGEFCDDGSCVSIECVDSSDCSAGEECRRFVCVDEGSECTDGARECDGRRAGQVCEDGQWEGFNCNADEICREGRCVEEGGNVCEPGTRGCIDENNVGRCNDTGTNIVAIECDLDEFCSEGFCVEEGSQNVCGGTATLEGTPGDECTTPAGDAGFLECTGPNSLDCLGEGEQNACGGTEELDAEPGEDCFLDFGVEGVVECDGFNAVVCVETGGGNACGGTEELEGEPGDPCTVGGFGGFGGEEGFLTCTGPNTLECDTSGSTNACGGDQELDADPGDPCQTAGGDAGIIDCDGPNDVACYTDGGGACTSDSQCVAQAEALGASSDIANRAACDAEVGCFTRGICNPDGAQGQDPFDAECLGGASCFDLSIVGIGATCLVFQGGCGTLECRDGEVCFEQFGGAGCIDPDNPPDTGGIGGGGNPGF